MTDSCAQAYQVPDNQLTPEELAERKKCEELRKKQASYSNSWEKNEAAGFGSPKTRVPTTENFDNLEMNKWGWDFQVDGVEYDIYHIPGYPHSLDNNIYFCPKDDVPTATNLKPFDKEWEAVDWSYSIKEIKTWRYKWDEIRTSSGWLGYLYRNGKVFDTVRSDTANNVWNRLQVLLMEAKEHVVGFHFRNWKKEAIGRKVWYYDQPCIIESVSDYDGVRFRLVGDTIDKRIPSPSHWQDDDDSICNKSHWEESYASGCMVEWNSKDISWYRK